MTKVALFIHGTGVRKPSYEASMRLLRRRMEIYLKDWDIQGCQWGDAFGARLHGGGASIPKYAHSGDESAARESAEQALWILLDQDPLLELRIEPVVQVIGPPPGSQIWDSVVALAHPGKYTFEAVEQLDLLAPWQKLIAAVEADFAWQAVVRQLTCEPQDVYEKVARGLIAKLQIDLRADGMPGLTGESRDQLVTALTADLGTAAGIGDWMLGRLTNFVRSRRGKLHDASTPAAGDILQYQARGAKLRNFIGEEVGRTRASVLIAHSLGGVAAVDWLAESQRSISHLITVGSQAPFFYEMDALASRAWGSGLPKYFPRWLNFFDERDFLSYVAQGVFPEAIDCQVDNGQPFPESHSAYWRNDKVWENIVQFLD
ncbi:hypothetical protein ACSFA8_22560 [Variovorax sp. RT4R15]|uniref:hypothetical protein n=1 Tax=Variovorax sp. RT4R15 TaxID=3443737 RepID=UPI003F464BC7